MKIVSRKEFMELPSGVVFSYYGPCAFNGLMVKDSEPEKGYPDFCLSNLIGAVDCSGSEDFVVKCEDMENGESRPVDFESSGREGHFDDKQLYAIYEKEDVDKLIKRLTPYPIN
jgi:hypothetical protein